MALKIYTTAEWNARPVSSTFPASAAHGIAIHHTAGANRTPQSGDAEVKASFNLARQIQAYHIDHNGWADTGNHWTVSRGGIVLEGRHGSMKAAQAGKCVKGAHAGNDDANAHWQGIENEGNYEHSLTMPQVQWNALVALCRQLQHWGGFPPEKIEGHQKWKATACPGLLMDRLPELRRLVAEGEGPAFDVAIVVCGEGIPEKGYLKDTGRSWVPVRKVYAAMPAEWQAVNKLGPITTHGAGKQIELIFEGGSKQVPCEIHPQGDADTGFVQSADLKHAGVIAFWDGPARTVHLDAQD